MRRIIAAVTVAAVLVTSVPASFGDSPKQHVRDTLGQSLMLAPGSRFNVEREKIICGLLGDKVCQEIVGGFAARGLSDEKLAYLKNRLSSLQGALWKSYDKLYFDTTVPMFLAELYRLLGYPDRAAEIVDQAIVHAYAELYSNYAMDIPRVFYNSLVSPRNAKEQKLLDAINHADPKFMQRFSDEFHAGVSPEYILTQDIVAKFVYSRVIGDEAYWIRKGIFSPAVEAAILDHFPKLEAALSGETRKARLAAVISLMGRAGVLRQEQDHSAIPGFDRILEWINTELHGDRSVVIGQDDNGLNAYGKRVWNFLLPELMQPEMFTHKDGNVRRLWRLNSCFAPYWGPYIESRIQWLVDTLSHQLHRNGTMNILDLMSGRFSYVPRRVKCRVVALGMNAEELAKNETADAVIVQDLVENPTLALDSNSQDMVIVVSGIQYIDPREVLKEAKRVLRPGGMLLIIGAWNATIMERQIQGCDGSVGFIAGLMKRAGFDEIFYHVGLVFQTESHSRWPYAVWSLKEPASSLGRFDALAAGTIRASNLAPGSKFESDPLKRVWAVYRSILLKKLPRHGLDFSQRKLKKALCARILSLVIPNLHIVWSDEEEEFREAVRYLAGSLAYQYPSLDPKKDSELIDAIAKLFLAEWERIRAFEFWTSQTRMVIRRFTSAELEASLAAGMSRGRLVQISKDLSAAEELRRRITGLEVGGRQDESAWALYREILNTSPRPGAFPKKTPVGKRRGGICEAVSSGITVDWSARPEQEAFFNETLLYFANALAHRKPCIYPKKERAIFAAFGLIVLSEWDAFLKLGFMPKGIRRIMRHAIAAEVSAMLKHLQRSDILYISNTNFFTRQRFKEGLKTRSASLAAQAIRTSN